MNSWLKVLLVYGILLGLSHATVAWLRDHARPLIKQTLILEEPTPANTHHQPPVIFFHGISGPREALVLLGKEFSIHGRKAILPNLYTFESAEEDGSLSDRALIFSEDWFAEHPDQVHLVGTTLGAAAAVEVATRYPGRIRSLTLISASLTQSFEMLGDYSLNRALYSLQSGGFWFLENLVPHFGAIHWIPGEHLHLKTWAETDLRGMEETLKALPVPALIIHGVRDFLVPSEAAQFHHSLIPRSRLILTDMDHSLHSAEGISLYSEISSYLESVEAGTFSPEPASPASSSGNSLTGKRFWWIAAIIFVGTKVSEDLATVAAGLLVSQGVLPFWAALLICFFGIVVGDTALYFFGRFAGIGLLRKRPFSWILKEQNVLDAEEWFQKRGLIVVVISRFVPATRLPVYVSTGILGVPPLKFISVLSLAALIWTPLIVGLTTLLGKPLLAIIETYEQWALPILIVFFLVITLLFKCIFPLVTRRGRRLLYRRWVRVRNFCTGLH